MSGSVSSAALAFTPVIVVQFGSGSNNNRKKKRQNVNSNWHVCDSLWQISSALSSSFSFFVLIFLLVLCSIGGGDSVIGSEISSNSYTNGLPTFDANDFKNLIEIFPEFREYVFRVVSSQVERQQQNGNSDYGAKPTTTAIASFSGNKFSSGNPIYNEETSPNSRNDFFSFPVDKKNSQFQVSKPSISKHGYGWPHYDDHYNKHPHHHSHHDHDSHHGYGYKLPSHYGWSSEHTTEIQKDPKFHYQVGYQLGKDLSCLFGLLGFKSIKDFSIYSIFSFLKKLKYVVLIGLAFKLGIILSPIALPMLFPIILLAVIAKILPLLLIIVLLFKLLKTQLKLGIGRRDGESGNEVGVANGVSSFMEGTSVSRLWKSIEDATQTVVESENCVEKIICKMIQKSEGSINDTLTVTDNETLDIPEAKSFPSTFFGADGFVPRLLSNMLDRIILKRKWKIRRDKFSEREWECDKIECN